MDAVLLATMNPLRNKIAIAALGFVGLTMGAMAARNFPPGFSTPFIAYLIATSLAAALKVNLPGVRGTLSANFLFVLFAILEMSAVQTIVIAGAGTIVQCAWRPKNRQTIRRTLFGAANTITASALSYYFYHSFLLRQRGFDSPLALLVTTLVFLVANTGPVAAAIAITERKPLGKTWHECYFWCLPIYLLGSSIAWLLHTNPDHIPWHGSILLLPIMYFIYHSYRLYMDRFESEQRHLADEKKHVEEIADLHLRTIEALALAIEAKDRNTYAHLNRVRTFAVEIGRELALPHQELEALRAAALLHDIGKLAVPEHIIAKPGKLTAEEFEKMKIHPIVGAEIIDRVRFPYPVGPIVRAHHEKWDGSGYPAGLKGEEIPRGARILAAVDCFDALTSDRQYRRALSVADAMEYISSLSGASFDPAVVAILQRRHIELEQMAEPWKPFVRLPQDTCRPRAAEPGAGLETVRQSTPVARQADFLSFIAAARQEVQLLFELTQDLGTSLSLDGTLSLVATRLQRMIPYDSLAVYVCRDNVLLPEYVNGENFRLFSSLRIPLGEGVSGWVAANRKPILNGNPLMESGYTQNDRNYRTLQSALSVPLEGLNGLLGVLTLYRSEKEAFSHDHLRILLAINSKVSRSIENALQFRQAEDSATTDYLTSLPNARSLFLRLDSDVSRCQRERERLAVLVCDLDGFKQLNDRCGHLEGNRLLQKVASALRDNCRRYDYVARMGGDEFVLILPDIDADALSGRITELRQLACDAGREVGTSVLSMSVGEALYPDDASNAEQLLEIADRRMYVAKQAAKSAKLATKSQENGPLAVAV